jgi:ABC-2 type transport system permease protein
VGRFGQREFVTYFLAVLVVRILTSSWMVWELTMDIRQGRLATRLLRPLHPLLAYSAQHLAAVPMRALVVSPLVVVLLVVNKVPLRRRDPRMLGLFLLSLVGAWLLLFSTMVLIGTWPCSSTARCRPSSCGWASTSRSRAISTRWSCCRTGCRRRPVLPFRYMLGFPAEVRWASCVARRPGARSDAVAVRRRHVGAVVVGLARGHAALRGLRRMSRCR